MTDGGLSYAAIGLTTGVFRVLVLLVMAALLVLTIVTWKRYPRTALFVLLAIAAWALGNLIALVSSFALPSLGAEAYRTGLLVVNVLASLLDLAGLGLLGVALFLRRPKEEPVAPRQPTQPTQPPMPYYGTQPTPAQPGSSGPPPPPPAQPGPGGPTPLWPGNPGQ